jgi:hypothetical protein
MRKAIGMNKPKKMTPKTIGLTIIPSNNPKRMQSLFIGRRSLDLRIVTTRNRAAKPKINRDTLVVFSFKNMFQPLQKRQ